MQEALIIVDMIWDFVYGKFGTTAAQSIIPNIKLLVDTVREQLRDKIIIIYLQDAHEPDDPEFKLWGEHALINTKGSTIISELTPQSPPEIVIQKQTYSGFYRTELQSLLAKYKVDTLIFTGVSTNICVQHTVADAFFRRYKKLIVASDGCAAINPEAHEQALIYMKEIYGAIITECKTIKSNNFYL